MASDETPVERRLRAMLHGIEYDELIGADPKAIDCGREAIRLLRIIVEHTPRRNAWGECFMCSGRRHVAHDPTCEWMLADALLARCMEGPR